MKIIKKFFKILIIVSSCIFAALCAGCKVPKVPDEPPPPKNYGGYEEGLYAVFEEASPKNAKVFYKEKSAGESGWVQVEEPLIYSVGEGLARVDAIGLKAGEYNLKIISSSGKQTALNDIIVSSYDRSGYAHFARKTDEAAYDGVGAYKDDGTIKDNTLIVYVTDENKNDVSDYVYLNGKKVDITDYFPVNWQLVPVTSIGYFFNGGNLTGTYSPIQQLIKTGIADAVAVRFIGKVNAEVENDGTASLIDGLTLYGSGNGRMARILNCKNVTLEGVGTDAEIYGWGFDFYAQQKYESDIGTSFEVRNLTFKNYPEDAIGMEGSRSYGEETLDCAVERCWIHNNNFYKGFCATPVEPDKADGDGSVDFKRGQYYTLSYNYFEETNKTCLIGGDDNTLQYNVTFHHNRWNRCAARKPLLRRANIHYYNNYLTEDFTNHNHVISLRAYCYMFMEANYFDGCYKIAQYNGSDESGAAKAFGNVYIDCRGIDVSTKVASRTDKVENQCGNVYADYSSFDTDPALFYYDPVKQVSDCLLDTAEQARTNVMLYAGVHGFGSSPK